MGPDEILRKLTAILPGFGPRWEDPDNVYRRDDGSFTPCGVFSECSEFVRERYETLGDGPIDVLASFLEECMTHSQPGLADAAATCFLENLTGERFSADFQRRLSGEALKFFRGWGGT